MRLRKILLPFAVIASNAVGSHAVAALLSWPADGVRVCSMDSTQGNQLIVSDGSGGAFIAWLDDRTWYTGILAGPYVQHLTGDGRVAAGWPAEGMPITGADYPEYIAVTENDGGGAWLAWDTYRNIVLGHVGASGSSVETRTVDVSAAVVPPESPKGGSAEASSPQRLAKGPRDYHPVIASDGTSGLLVGWLHDTWSSGRYPVAARYDQSLRPLWTVNLSTRSGFATPPVICGDGSGGAFVAWVQVSQIGSDIAAVHVSASGSMAPGWSATGNWVCDAPGYQDSPGLVPDGSGGVIIAWQDHREGYAQPFVQHLAVDGTATWGPDGLALCRYPIRSVPTTQSLLDPIQTTSIVGDGAGGAIVAWTDYGGAFVSGGGDIHAQHITGQGILSPGWRENGLRVCGAPDEQRLPVLVSDGSGGIFVTWDDNRSGTNWDIFAQHVLGSGAIADGWAQDGVALCSTSDQQGGPVIAAGGDGGAFVAWQDLRDPKAHIYAARIGTDAAVPVLVSLVSSDAEPGRVRLTWQFSESDLEATVYRRDEAAGWAAHGRAIPDGEGRALFEDLEVRPGMRYGYRLGVSIGGREEYFGEVTVAVPRMLAFALDRPRPNPSRRAISISFALAKDSPARLELLDLAGRIVLTREMGSLGPGVHTLSLDVGTAIPPGSYVIRLTQGPRSLAVKATIVR